MQAFFISHYTSRLYRVIIKKWCPDPDLNQGHEDFQSSALPTELSGHLVNNN